MRAATARALAPASGYDPRGGRRRAAASSRPWSAVPTLHGSSSSTPSSGTPRVSARRRPRSRSVVSATSATSTESTREGESGDARRDVPGATAPSPTPGADADASASRDDSGRGARSLTPGQRRAAEKKAIHAKRHPNGHDKQVSLHLRAKAKARRGDAKGALEELRRGAARFPKNAHIGVSFARALADDFDESDPTSDGETNALLCALKHLDFLEDSLSKNDDDAMDDVSKSRVLQLRGVLEARRLELAVADPTPGRVSAEKTEKTADVFSAPSAGRARAAFEASVAADPRHWAAWHAWGTFEMRRGRVNKARRLLREARRSDPRRARTAQTLAVLEASAAGENDAAAFHAARSLFAEAIALDATHAPSYTAWARMEQRAGNVTRAARVFRQGEEATRNAARDAHAYGVTVTKSRRDDVDGDPLFSRSALLTAYGAFEARRAPGSAKARSHARTLFREACDCGGRRNPRAFAAWAAAETAFDEIAEKARSNGLREKTRQEDTQHSNALRVLTEGLNAHPGNERLLHARACALRLAGDADGAVAAFEALLSSKTGKRRATRNPKTWHAFGGALRDAGRFDDAVDAFERGAFCQSGSGQFADDGSDEEMDGMNARRVNLPCLTSAAAEAARGGDAARARRLFARGSALASPGEDALSPFETFETFEPEFGRTGSVSTVSVGLNATDRGATDGDRRQNFEKPTAFERSTHLRLWAAFEKRDGRYVTARDLFARASRANPGDALVWLQWGQFERRVEGPDAARTRFQSGARRVTRPTSARAFLYQAWADLETNVGDTEAARAVYERACSNHPGSPELWLARGAFEAELAAAELGADGPSRDGPSRDGDGDDDDRSFFSREAFEALEDREDREDPKGFLDEALEALEALEPTDAKAKAAKARTNETDAKPATRSVDAHACFARAAALAAGTAFARSVRDARRVYGDLDLEEARGAAGGARGEEGALFDGSDDDARGLGLAEW